MNRFDPSELSGFLDGELSPERTRQLEEIFASEPTVGDELKLLATDDAMWRTSARAAAFRPQVSLRPIRASAIVNGCAALFVALLLVAQSLMRWFGVLNLILIVNALALAVLLTGIVLLATRPSPGREYRATRSL